MRERETFEKNYRPQYVYSDYSLVDETTGLRLIKEHMSSSEYKRFVKENSALFLDGFLLGNDRGNQEDFYNAFDRPEVLNDFERLDFDRSIDELGFVKKYGLLGFSNKKKLKPILNKVEPLAWFRSEQEQYHTMMEIYECITIDPRPNLIRTHLQYLKGFATSFSLNRYARDYLDANLRGNRDQLLTLSTLFAIMLDQRLQLSHPTLWITDRSKPSKFIWGLTSDSLIADIYLMFWREITRQTELKKCPGCGGKFFELKQGKGRKQKYHTKACSNAHRQRELNKRLGNKEVKDG